MSFVRKLTALWLLVAVPLLAEENWELVRDRDGIQVYSQPVEGSDFNAVRGVTRISSSLSRLVTLVRDPELRPLWDEYCGESYIYKQLNSREELVYLHSELPWPVSDRDMLNRVTWSQDAGTLEVTMRSVATRDILQEKEGRVRVAVATNDWQLRPKEAGWIELTTTVHLDPAGPLPAWLLNKLSVEAPYRSLLNLRELAASDKIPLQQHEFLLEPNEGVSNDSTSY